MTRCIDEIDFISFPGHPHWCEFYCNSSLLLYLHCVEHLTVFHFAFFLGSGEFEHPICKGGFAVIDMRNDSEVSDRHVCILIKRMKMQLLSLQSLISMRFYDTIYL